MVSLANKRRVGMCAVVFAAAFSVLGLRLTSVVLGGYEPKPVKLVAQANSYDRPEIFDRNGSLIAVNLPMRGLEVAGNEVWDPAEVARVLGDIFPSIDKVDLEQKLEKGRYVSLRVNLTPAKEEAVFEKGIPGVRFKSLTKRYYPQARTASHLVGHLEDGKGGVSGYEYVLDNAWKNEKPLKTSIDIRAQQVVERVLAKGVEKYHAKAGWVGVIDVTTGEIVSLASYPDFDPNDPGSAEPEARRNRAIYDRYEFGSAFKVFTAATALELGLADEMSMLDARFGSYKVADRTIRDYHGENRLLTVSEVIQHSSNIGAARLAGDIGIKNQKKALKKLGFFDPLPIPFVERRSPELPSQWGPVEAATISYGHGISVTSLHLLSAYGAIVNGGVYRRPTFFLGEKKSETIVISEKTSKIMRRILRRVVTNGTASAAEVPGYFPIGKTATADKPVEGGYDKSARLSSFVGAFPGYAPRYAVLVSLDEPQPTEGTFGFATAGWNAAPLFSEITEQIAPILGVMPAPEDEAIRTFVAAANVQIEETSSVVVRDFQ